MKKPTIRALIKKILFYKYLSLVGILLIVSSWVYITNGSFLTIRDFQLGFFFSVVSAILISLFYDIFTRKDNRLIQSEELNDIKSHISNNFLTYVDFDRIHEETLKEFVKLSYHNDTFLKAFSREISQFGEDTVYHSLFKPLRNGNILNNVIVENILSPTTDKSSYLLEFVQKFNIPKGMKEFLVFFSCDNETFNQAVFLNSCCVDAAVGVSEVEWSKIEKTIKQMSLKGQKVYEGKLESFELEPIELKDLYLKKRIPIKNLDVSKVKAFIYHFNDFSYQHQFEFSYKVVNNLGDPYYYWIAENPMYLNSVSIVYEKIKQSVGVVSANCIMGNQIFEPKHDYTKGIFTININGLVWPGNGALIVWRPKNI